jgi:hypothetical protein
MKGRPQSGTSRSGSTTASSNLDSLQWGTTATSSAVAQQPCIHLQGRRGVGVKDRLRRLQEAPQVPSAETSSRNPLDTYLRDLENLERKKAGLPPLPYTGEDRQDDEEFLLETLPFYRANLG